MIDVARLVAQLVAIAVLPACGNVPIGADRADGGADAGGPGSSLPCVRDTDCMTDIDYCGGGCGVCRAVIEPSVAKCQPPPNVFCMDVCAGQRAVCLGGFCAMR